MTSAQYNRSQLLMLMAAGGMNPIPQPLEYWRKNLICVVGEVKPAEVEEALSKLEEAGLVASQVDALTIRRYWVTPNGVASVAS